MNRVERFFNDYAYDFDAIYGKNKSVIDRIINPVFRKSMRLRFEKTMLYSQPVHNKTFLDIGCGPGHYGIALARRGARETTGIDFSENMIGIAKAKAASLDLTERCHFIVEDIFTYNPKEKFDYVIVMGVMDYIENPSILIEKVLNLITEKAFFSFPATGGILALQRKIRYRKRCPLFLYSEEKLKDLFNEFHPAFYKIERIARGYFVSVTKKQSG